MVIERGKDLRRQGNGKRAGRVESRTKAKSERKGRKRKVLGRLTNKTIIKGEKSRGE